MKKICIFPSDSITSYYKKGEIKERYYNPCNYFDEVHIISSYNEEVTETDVQKIAGNSRLKIHSIGKYHMYDIMSLKKAVYRLVKEINPDIFRAYNPYVQGYLAVSCGKKFGKPSVISVHARFDKDQELMLEHKKYFELALHQYNKIFQSYSFRNATKVICAYNFLVDFATKCGAKNVEVIYNRVDTSRFKKVGDEKHSDIRVICVGNLTPGKNQEVLIRAIKDLDVKLLLIGNGPLYQYLVDLAADLKIADKVTFIKYVPNSELHKCYAASDIFAIPIKHGGICIPAIEAMASSLPLVVPKPRWEKEPELVGDIAVVVENTPDGFKKGIAKLIASPELRKKLGDEGRKRALGIDSKIMEEKEMMVYKKLLGDF